MKKISILSVVLSLNILVFLSLPTPSLANTTDGDYILLEESTRVVNSTHQFKITLSESISDEFLKKEFIFIEDTNGNLEDITLALNENKNVISITSPKNGYKTSGIYTIYISSKIKSVSGKSINHGTKLNFTVKEDAEDTNEESSQENLKLLKSKKGMEDFTLPNKDDEVFFQLHLNAGEAISFDILNNTNIVKAYLYHFDEEKEKWVYIKNHNGNNNHREDTGTVSYMAEKDGNYQIRVSPNHSAPWGSTRKLSFDYEVLAGDSEELDSKENARYLSNQSGEKNFTLHALNDIDYFNFDLNAGEKLKFEIEGTFLGDTGRYAIYHYDLNENNWVLKKNDFYDSRAESINFIAKEKGIYQLTYNASSIAFDNWSFKSNLKLKYSKE